MYILTEWNINSFALIKLIYKKPRLLIICYRGIHVKKHIVRYLFRQSIELIWHPCNTGDDSIKKILGWIHEYYYMMGCRLYSEANVEDITLLYAISSWSICFTVKKCFVVIYVYVRVLRPCPGAHCQICPKHGHIYYCCTIH